MLVLGLIFLQMSAVQGQLYPDGWEAICTRNAAFIDWTPQPPSFNWSQPITQIHCQIENSEVLSIRELRIWSESLTGPVAVSIHCVNTSGNVGFPWPYKAKHLVYLKIVNCHNKQHFSEFTKDNTTLKQELRVLILENVSNYFFSSQLIHLADNVALVSKDAHCLSVVLEKYVVKNIKTVPKMDTSDPQEFLNAMNTWSREEQLIPHRCRYNFFQYMDESSSKLTGSKRFLNQHQKGAFPELRFYNLSNMGYTLLPKELQDWRFYYPKLEYMDLSWNKLTSFEFFDYSGDPSAGVGIIDLRHNNISEISAKQLEVMSLYVTVVLDVRENPLACECDTNLELIRFVTGGSKYSFAVLPDQMRYIENLTCASPEIKKGAPLTTLKPEDLVCILEDENGTFIATVSVLSICFVLIVTGCVLGLVYRREVVVFLFTKFGIIFQRRNSESKEFDAFISYSSRDDDWVIGSLVKRLETGEKGPAFKLCVHHRDFEIGAAIADNVVRSVEESRHTILVLSKNYIKSEWCIYEFRTAMHQSLIERRKHMIIIVLETVPKGDMDKDLRKCLETFTYISVSDRMFWSKLSYTLSCGRPSTHSVSSSARTSTSSLPSSVSSSDSVV